MQRLVTLRRICCMFKLHQICIFQEKMFQNVVGSSIEYTELFANENAVGSFI